MANVINFIQTNAADELISKVLTGKTLNFTRMAVGDGFSYDTNVAKGFTTLVNEVLSLDITKKETLSASSVRITSAFKNTDAQKEFYYREVGLFAEDPDTGEEVLYAYGNRNDAAELITPTGSNVVTKQLVFVISVGDSANVTFNVNADVYALQSDMLDVQANKADKNLANTGMITNCLLEVPQRIKYTLKNGKITIQAGTIIIVPYGNNEPTYAIGDYFLNDKHKIVDYQYIDNKLFYWLEIQEDISAYNDQTSVKDKYYLSVCFNPSDNTAGLNAPRNSESGANTVSTLVSTLYYHNSDNIVYSNNASTTSFTEVFNSLPLAIGYSDGIYYYGSITQVFNGMGYIGSTVWVDKGVKGLVSDGFNKNGIRASINSESNAVYTYTFDNPAYNGDYIISLKNIVKEGTSGLYFKKINGIVRQKEKPSTINTWWLDETNNQWKYIDQNGNIINYWWLDICECNLVNGIITSLKPYSTFQAVNYNDYIDQITKLESRISALEAN